MVNEKMVNGQWSMVNEYVADSFAQVPLKRKNAENPRETFSIL